jgi:hypothetical protein
MLAPSFLRETDMVLVSSITAGHKVPFFSILKEPQLTVGILLPYVF